LPSRSVTTITELSPFATKPHDWLENQQSWSTFKWQGVLACKNANF